MQCERCNGVVTWRGPLSNLTHTQCESCGGINCQRVEYTEDDNIEERPTMTTPQQTLERAYAALNAAAFAHPSAADDIGTQCAKAAEEIRALLAQPAAAGQGQAATQEMLDGLLEAAQYLSHRRRVAAAPPAPGGDVPKPLGWIYENSLPGNYPYDAMYPYSAIRHGVRMFPVFAPVAALQSTQGQTASAITSHLKTLESKYMEWCGYGRMPLTEGQFKYLLDKIAAEVTAPTATQGQDAAPADPITWADVRYAPDEIPDRAARAKE